MRGGSNTSYPNKNVPASAPRGVKNNNPGNIRISPNAWRGKLANNTDGQFEQFETMVMGARAHLKNLQTYFNKGENTIRKIIDDGNGYDWSPKSENDSEAYMKFVANHMRITPETVIVPTSGNLIDLAFAMSKMENGTHSEITRQVYVEGFGAI